MHNIKLLMTLCTFHKWHVMTRSVNLILDIMLILHGRTDYIMIILHGRTDYIMIILHGRTDYIMIILHGRTDYIMIILHGRTDYIMVIIHRCIYYIQIVMTLTHQTTMMRVCCHGGSETWQ